MRVSFGKLFRELRQDIRFTLRQLRTYPVFSAIVIATFAVGIAANTATFSVMDALVLRPLAVPDLNRVVTVAELHGGGGGFSDLGKPVSFADYRDDREQSRSFTDPGGAVQLAARSQGEMTLTGLGGSERGGSAQVRAARATVNLFALYRMEPLLGRGFAAGEDEPGRDGEVVLTYAFWQTHFGGRPEAVGEAMVLDGRAYTVVGVMPASFDHVAFSDVWLPLALTPAERNDRSARNLTVVGRLAGGATVASATEELDVIAAGIGRRSPATNQNWTVRVRPLVETINGEYTPTYTRIILLATLLLMVVVCANISNLQFARTVRRAPEMAMRCALGSSRSRIVRQLLVESVTQSLLGVVVGLGLAQLLLHLIVTSMPAQVSRFLAGWDSIGLNGRTLGYSVGVAVVAGVLAGLAPALVGMRVNLVEQLKLGSRSVAGAARSHRLRNLLAGAQVMLATALVAGAALIAASMYSMLRQTMRFAPQQSLLMKAYLPPAQYGAAEKQAAFLRDSIARLGGLPGVRSAEFTTALPYNNTGVWWQEMAVLGEQALPGESRTTQRLMVSPGFARSMGIPLLQGRFLSPSDAMTTLPVAVISQRLARQYFAGKNPLGAKIVLGTGATAGTGTEVTAPLTVVGVVGDVIYTWVDQTPQPAVYLSVGQFPATAGTYILRTDGDPRTLETLEVPARQTLAALDATVPVNDVETYAAFLHESLIGLSYAASMLAADAGIALLLCGLGIFGVMANLVTERTQEIGIRFAMGADRGAVLRLMLRRSLVITAVGVVAGCLLSLEVNRVLASLLEGVRGLQGLILLAATLIVAGISVLAGYLPARRAAGVDPALALHAE
jgi:putative ABC transport system permease protein